MIIIWDSVYFFFLTLVLVSYFVEAWSYRPVNGALLCLGAGRLGNYELRLGESREGQKRAGNSLNLTIHWQRGELVRFKRTSGKIIYSLLLKYELNSLSGTGLWSGVLFNLLLDFCKSANFPFISGMSIPKRLFRLYSALHKASKAVT